MDKETETPRLHAIVMPWDELAWALQQFVDPGESFGPDTVMETVLRLKYNCSEIDVESGDLFNGEYMPTVTIGHKLLTHAHDIATAVMDAMECGRVQVDVQGFIVVDPPEASA